MALMVTHNRSPWLLGSNLIMSLPSPLTGQVNSLDFNSLFSSLNLIDDRVASFKQAGEDGIYNVAVTPL